MPAFPGILMSGLGASKPQTITLHESAHWQAASSYALGLIVTVSSGASLIWSVQITGDVQPSTTGFWNNHDVLLNQTASANDSIAYPVTGVRLVINVYVSGTCNLSIVRWP